VGLATNKVGWGWQEAETTTWRQADQRG